MPEPTPMPTPLPTAIELPDGLDGFAWSSVSKVSGGNDAAEQAGLAGGRLGASASFVETRATIAGYPSNFATGGLAVNLFRTDNGGRFEIWRASDGVKVGQFDVSGFVLGYGLDSTPAQVDVARSLIYFAVRLPGGGADIRRASFDGGTSTTVLSLDARFTPDGIPTERFTYGLDPSGTLVVLACASADGCRLWEIEPETKTAPGPRTLAASTPIVCDGLAVSERWIVVSDDYVCYADYGEAPFPMRAIDRRDGSTHSLGDESQVMPARIVTEAGRELAVAARRNPDWSATSILTIDIVSGARRIVAGPFQNGDQAASGDQAWLGLDPIVLPDAWVLVDPWGVADSTQPIPDARLVNVATGDVVELPPGTFGWR